MKSDPQLLKRPLKDYALELSSRAYNVLYRNEIDTVGELAALELRQLRKLRNCGRKVSNELRSLLQKLGLDLALPDPAQEVFRLQIKVESLQAAVWQKDAEIAQLKAELNRLARLPMEADLLDRLEVQVNRFEQLMSKLFRKERRQALVQALVEVEDTKASSRALTPRGEGYSEVTNVSDSHPKTRSEQNRLTHEMKIQDGDGIRHDESCPAVADDESDYEFLSDAGECVCGSIHPLEI